MCRCLTGDESRAAEVKDVDFPKLLDPVDDQPPATVVTRITRAKDGKWSDPRRRFGRRRHQDGDRERPGGDGDGAEFRGVGGRAGCGDGRVAAHAEDAAGNVETHAHVITLSREP